MLIVEDDQEMCRMISRGLDPQGLQMRIVHSLEDARAELNRQSFPVVLLDLHLPDGSGLDLLPELQTGSDDPEVIIMTAFGGRESAEIAMKNNVWDYLKKPFSIQELRLLLERALKYHREKNRRTHVVLNREQIIGDSPAMTRCLDTMALAAMNDVSVLITGETGTGKELFAWAIHQNSLRNHKGMVVLDCTVLPESLMESTLFGHVKGAFTGAATNKAGLVAEADGGSLFLDEIGELPLNLQKKLLRVLQERVYRPVGSRTEQKSDFRLLCATNRNLEEMVEKGTFREDLLYRIRSLSIEVPPLRERRQDIEALANHHIKTLCQRYDIPLKRISSELLEDLKSYEWPGNVREMLNVIDRMLTMARHEGNLYPVHLPKQVRVDLVDARTSPQQGKTEPDPLETGEVDVSRPLKEIRDEMIQRLESSYLEQVLKKTSGDVKQACAFAGLARSQFYNLIKKYDIDR